jgi:GT2 family glycosyltransferase
LKISIIIPTHNRADILENAIKSILALESEAELELVVVDNNSKDHTKDIVQRFAPFARYVFEGRTAFSMARKAGADAATGDIFLYLDDDILVKPGSFTNIVEIFQRHVDCGVIAGHIDPKYDSPPPQWASSCQSSFNGWSLFNPETYSFITSEFQEVPSAAGPMMAIRRTAYEQVGGFPPDTVGVETNKGAKSFNKLYIGPGDYGLCHLIRQAGYRVYYSSKVAVFHVIPSVRFTTAFWRSRMIGEGYHLAITQRAFFNLSKFKLFLHKNRIALSFLQLEDKFLKKFNQKFVRTNKDEGAGPTPDELWIIFYKAYLDMSFVLNKYPDLTSFLWSIGSNGVADSEYEDIVGRLPREYKLLVSSDFVYRETLLSDLESFSLLIESEGHHKKSISRVFSIPYIRHLYSYLDRILNKIIK